MVPAWDCRATADASIRVPTACVLDWGDLAAGAGTSTKPTFGHEFRAFTGHVLDSWPLPAD
jgi:hypothetical protein